MRRIIPLVFILLIASSNAAAAEFKSAVGFGTQYAGIIGWQGSLHHNRHSLRLGVGLLGLGVMYEYASYEKLSIGLQAVTVAFAAGFGAYANYHFTSTTRPGWVLGIDYIDSYSTWVEKQEAVLAFSVGYKF